MVQVWQNENKEFWWNEQCCLLGTGGLGAASLAVKCAEDAPAATAAFQDWRNGKLSLEVLDVHSALTLWILHDSWWFISESLRHHQGIFANTNYNPAWRIASCQLSVAWLVRFGPLTSPLFMRCYVARFPKMHKMPVVSITRRCFGSDLFQILWEHHLVQISMTCLVIAGCCRTILRCFFEHVGMFTQGYNTLLNAHAKAADGAQAKEAALF